MADEITPTIALPIVERREKLDLHRHYCSDEMIIHPTQLKPGSIVHIESPGRNLEVERALLALGLNERDRKETDALEMLG